MDLDLSGLVIQYLREHPASSARDVYDNVVKGRTSYSTLQRLMREMIAKRHVTATGNRKSARYSVSAAYQVIHEIDPDEYFKREIDDRVVLKNFTHDLIRDKLNKIELFSTDEFSRLDELQELHKSKTAHLSKSEYRKNLETFAVDLSWKSSQIEGNTYSLLETERLLNEKVTAEGKTKDEAVMLLNHKEAIDFLIESRDLHPLTLRRIEDIHSMLIKELGVERNLRRRAVTISGTNYRPLDNEFQIKEAMEEMCALVNLRSNVFEKALLVLVLISYIQPFTDGNKRTARIVANGILWSNDYCPISFRTVTPYDYKRAMLIFYEQNNISAFKKIFIEQFEFAVKNYF